MAFWQRSNCLNEDIRTKMRTGKQVFKVPRKLHQARRPRYLTFLSIRLVQGYAGNAKDPGFE